jgi:hypothetical protein
MKSAVGLGICACALLGARVPAAADGLGSSEPGQPEARPGDPAACGVKLLRAPDELLVGIEHKLAALSVCEGRLDVWIVRAVDGLYVIARDELGRIRERVVADADVAALLIAAWVEIDAALPMVAPGDPTAATARDERDAPDGAVPPGAAESPAFLPRVVEAGPPPPAPRRTVGRSSGVDVFYGAARSGMTTTGVIVDHDVWDHDGLTVAAMLTLHSDVAEPMSIPAGGSFRELSRRGAAVLVELRRRLGSGLVRFTPSLAFGLGMTSHQVRSTTSDEWGVVSHDTSRLETSGPRIVASSALGLRLTSTFDLELTAGWMFSGFQDHSGLDPSDHAVTVGIGLRHQR